MKFTDLVTQISAVDGVARHSTDQTLQQILSLRNWLIGACIVEFEQAGEDRAAYGEALVRTLAKALAAAGCRGLSWRNLNNFRQLAFAYPGRIPRGWGSPWRFPELCRRLHNSTTAADRYGRRLPDPLRVLRIARRLSIRRQGQGRGGALEVNNYTSPDVWRICRPPQRFRGLVVVLAQYLNLRYCPAFSRGR